MMRRASSRISRKRALFPAASGAAVEGQIADALKDLVLGFTVKSQ